MENYLDKIKVLEERIKAQFSEINELKKMASEYESNLSFGNEPVDIEINPASNNISNWNDAHNWKDAILITCKGVTGTYRYIHNLTCIYNEKFGDVSLQSSPKIGCLEGSVSELNEIRRYVEKVMEPIVDTYKTREFTKVIKSKFNRFK